MSVLMDAVNRKKRKPESVYSAGKPNLPEVDRSARAVDTFGGERGNVLTPEQQYRRSLRQSLGVTDVRKASGGALSRIVRAGLVGGAPDTIGSEETAARIRRARKRYGGGS